MRSAQRVTNGGASVAELQNGDRLGQREFHELYERMPEDCKAELIGGIVFMASPLKRGHARNHIHLGMLLHLYETSTPGVESGDNGTVILSDENEPQPDLFLRIMPEFGGQSKTTADDYIEGPPELLAEIACSSRSIDLHDKREQYARHGILEYLVLNVSARRLHWFDLRRNKELSPGDDGVCRIHCFPGLWIEPAALLAGNSKKTLRTLKKGLASPGHAEFVRKLNRRAK